jgi:opacity protein-like surface antigen
MKKTLLSAAFALMFFAYAAAQPSETGKNEFTVWGGFSPDSNTWLPAFGRTPDVRFGMVAFRYSRRFNNNDTVNLKYTADAVPAAFLNYPDFEIEPGTPPSIRVVRATRYAFGAAPLGLQVNFRPQTNVQPFIGSSGGFLYFNERTPNFGGTRFAFTADVGAGVEIKLKEKRAVTVGYKYYHISNWDRGIVNPGYDNNLFYVGYTFFTK